MRKRHIRRRIGSRSFVAVRGGPAVVDGRDSADDDDARSIGTDVPHKLEIVDEEDERTPH